MIYGKPTCGVILTTPNKEIYQHVCGPLNQLAFLSAYAYV
jgi:hypothetical protein